MDGRLGNEMVKLHMSPNSHMKLRRNSKLENIIFLFVLKVASLSVFDQEQLISIEIHLRLKLLEMSSKTVAWG